MVNYKVFLQEIISLSVVFLCCFFTSPAWACYTGYQQEDFWSRLQQGVPPNFFETSKGETIQELEQKFPYFSYQLISLPNLPAWQLIKFYSPPQSQLSYLRGRTGLYVLKDQKSVGYCLLEMIESEKIDPCKYEEAVISKITEKNLISNNYLPIAVPAGLRLEIYQQQQGKQISQTILLITPDPPYHQPPYISNRLIVMEAKYHKDLESVMKAEMTNYFTTQLPIWASRWQTN